MHATYAGVLYDTTRAKYIDGYALKPSFSERFEVMEYLYRTPTGEYFSGRFGGDRTEYAEGEITPLSPAAAKAWAAEHMEPEAAARMMPELYEAPAAEKGIQITLNITPESVRQFLTLASSYAPALTGALREIIGKSINGGHSAV